jgi:hypothetical protein
MERDPFWKYSQTLKQKQALRTVGEKLLPELQKMQHLILHDLMPEEYDITAIEETAEKLLNSLPELNIADESLSQQRIAERKFLRQVFRPLCYSAISYKATVEKHSLPGLIAVILNATKQIDGTTRRELEEKYIKPQKPVDWDAESRHIRVPENLKTTPSPEPLLRLSYACHLALPKPVRRHLTLFFYFGSE